MTEKFLLECTRSQSKDGISRVIPAPQFLVLKAGAEEGTLDFVETFNGMQFVSGKDAGVECRCSVEVKYLLEGLRALGLLENKNDEI